MPYKQGAEFNISKLEVKDDNMEIKLSIPGDPLGNADVKLMLGKDWQKTMSNESALETVEKFLSVVW